MCNIVPFMNFTSTFFVCNICRQKLLPDETKGLRRLLNAFNFLTNLSCRVIIAVRALPHEFSEFISRFFIFGKVVRFLAKLISVNLKVKKNFWGFWWLFYEFLIKTAVDFISYATFITGHLNKFFEKNISRINCR